MNIGIARPVGSLLRTFTSISQSTRATLPRQSSLFNLIHRNRQVSSSASTPTNETISLGEKGEKEAPVTVYWDAGCPLCTREINLMKSLDTTSSISFIALNQYSSSSSLESYPSVSSSSCSTETCSIGSQGTKIPLRNLLARFHAKEAGHDLVSGAAAFAAMWRAIPRLRWLGELARNRVVLFVLEGMYRGFLAVRPALQWFVRRVDGNLGK